VKARLIIAAALMIVPTIVVAQRGGGGGRRGGGGRGESGGASAKAGELKSDDIEKLNPAKILLDKRKDLKIDDAQKAQLETIATRYEWNTRVFVTKVDSIQGVAGSEKRSALVEALGSVRQEFDTASAHSMSVLTDAQRPQAAKLMERPTAEIESQLEKAGLGRSPRETPSLRSTEVSQGVSGGGHSAVLRLLEQR
jgi:hypothetical protein